MEPTLTLLIRQLYDAKKGTPLTVDEFPENAPKPDFIDRVSFEDSRGVFHEYKLYQHRSGEKPFKSNYVHFRNLLKSKQYTKRDPPFRFYKWTTDGDRIVDHGKIAHELWKRWGDGCYRIYWFGGQPPLDQVIGRTWIKKVR